VDVRAGELRKHGIRLKVQDQPFRVLRILLEHPGEVVTREELQRQIWPSDTFVDFDRGLNNAVKRLREALADSADEPRYIETIPKRGYRFIAAVHAANGQNGTDAKAPAVAIETASIPEEKRHFLNRRLPAALAAFVTIAAMVVGGVVLRDRFARGAAAASIRSIAVLPLQNLSGDPSQEYFADGMTEELITEISRLKDLKVISRTSVMRYKKTDKSLPEIARELNVEAVVEGSVLRSGDKVRITAQLISARTDANLWAETYDRSLQDSLAVQEAVATAIAGKIKTTMSPNAVVQLKPAGTVNLKAHEAYLLGLHETQLASTLSNHEGMGPASVEHIRRATEYYQQAIKEDPNYALAYLGLADGGDPNEVEANARKALELDDSLSEAHLEVAAVALARDLNWHGAEKEFLRAVEVNPNYAPAHQGYAYFLDASGKLDDGLREYHRAQELDPANDHLGAALYSRRDYSHLIELERRALATNPPGDTSENAMAHKVLMVAYARTGKRKESIDEMRSAIACMGFHDYAEEIRRGYLTGDYPGALRAYLRGAKKHPDWVFHWVEIYVYAELGDYDQAFARLARLNKDDPSLWQWVLQAEGMPTLASLRIEPMWDPLHSDPRFEELARQVGLPTESATQSKH
jgi:TolB-like protein/DNA-binding winged helix-turn-helix (wHTH) protein/Tfp pilus assembly protein PilF